MYNPYLISPDSFWEGRETTWLLKSTYQYVPVHTGMYKLGILVLACTVLYRYVRVRTGTYGYVPVRTILPNPVQGYRIPDVSQPLTSLTSS